MKKFVFRLLAIILILCLRTPVLAEDPWTCPGCGQEGNTGNFCSNCATPRPAEEWTCPNCGQEGNSGNFCSNCATPQTGINAAAVPVTALPTVNEHLEQIPGETEKVKVRHIGVEASSYIVNKQNPGRWVPENAADGDESTCWQFSAKKGLKGKSWILLNLPGETVDEIWFKNGFWAVNEKGKDQYPINARLKAVKAEFCYTGENTFRDSVELTLKDESRNGWQRFSVGHREKVARVRIAVVSVYKGSAFPNDVCLSEVMAVQTAAADTATPAGEQKAATVYESRPEITGCGLLMKLSTRSGPGTQYAEPGTFFGNNWKNQTVKVMKKSYDGGSWWVQVDFRNGSKKSYRVWTGVKRVDVDLNKVKEEAAMGSCDVKATSDTWYGPGGNYARAKRSIPETAYGIVYQIENGYADVEYLCYESGAQGRLWVPQSAIVGFEAGTDRSGE